MKKQGPCFHCGAERTPLWRNGPPEKPVLCNACGSRYRLGKPLENYAPKNIQIITDKKQRQNPKPKPSLVPSNACRLSSVLKEEYDSSESSSTSLYYRRLHIKPEKRSDESFPAAPVGQLGRFWSAPVPSRKRTRVAYNIFRPMQRFLIDLHYVLREEMCFSNESEGPDDVLIYNPNINKLQVPDNEIGLGSMLLKLPVTDSQQQGNDIDSCPTNICDKDSCSIDAPSHQLENACDDAMQNESSPTN